MKVPILGCVWNFFSVVCKSKYILKLCGEKIMENYCCILVVCNEVPGFLMWHSVTWPPGIKIQKEGHIVILF